MPFYSKTTGGFFHKELHKDGIPADAVEVSDEEYAALFSAQAAGKTISADDKGFPVAVDTDVSKEVLVAGIRLQRDRLLSASDWTQMADAPLSAEKKAAWVAYRQALRDLPNAAKFKPEKVTWPQSPQ